MLKIKGLKLPMIGNEIVAGDVKFVDSGGSKTLDDPNYGVDPEKTFATLDYAVGQMTANNGDYIICLPGHTETVSAAGGLDLDVVGITIIGLGNGSNRPTVNCTATSSDIDVDAANITMKNILFTGGIDAVAAMIDVNAADFTMVDCEIRDVTGQMTVAMVTDANADRMKLVRPLFRLAAAAGATEAIKIVGGDDIEIVSPKIYGNFSTAAINVATTATTRIRIHGSAECPAYIWNANSADVAIKDTITGSTGDIGPFIYIMMTDDAANITEAVTGATFHLFDPVYVCNAAGQKAMLINWTASADS